MKIKYNNNNDDTDGIITNKNKLAILNMPSSKKFLPRHCPPKKYYES